MHLFFQAGKKKNLLKIILATTISIFIIITLWISFSNYFIGNLQGFIFAPNFVYEGSNLNLVLSLRKSSDGEPVEGGKISIIFSDLTGKFIDSQNLETDKNGNANISQLIPTDCKDNVNIFASVKSKFGKISLKKVIPIKYSEKIDVFTDKNEYLPGDDVYLQCRISSKNISHGDRNLHLKLIDKEGKLLYSKTEKVESYGFFVGKIPIGKMIKHDTYKINISTSKASFEKEIKIGNSNSFSNVKLEVNPPYFISGKKNEIKVSSDESDRKFEEGTQITLLITEYSDSKKISEKTFSNVTDSTGKFSIDYIPSKLENSAYNPNNYIDIKTVIKYQNNDEINYSKSYPFSKNQFLTFFIPEDSYLTYGFQNRLFIFTCFPDGTPAETDIIVKLRDKKINLATSSEGISEIMIDPALEKGHVPIFTIYDKKGQKIEIPFDISQYSKLGDFTVSTENVFFKNDQKIPITIKSLDKNETFFVFLSKNKEIISSQTVNANSNTAKTEIQIPNETYGFCKIIISKIDSEGNLHEKNIPIYVFGENPISIALSSDKKIYQPEEQAKISFKFKDKGIIFTSLEKDSPYSEIIEDFISDVSTDFPLKGIIDKLNELPKPIQISSKKIQNIFRIILNKNETTENEISFENLYKQAIQSGYTFKINYYKSIFSIILKIFLWIAILSFLAMLFFTLRLCYISIFSKKEKIAEFSADETAGAIAFNMGIPLTFFVSFLSFISIMAIKQLDINTLFISRNIIWINAVIVVSLFLYLLTIRHFIHKHTIKKLDKPFLNVLSVMFIYILSLTLCCSMTIIAYTNLWNLWNYRTLFVTNISLSEFVALTFLIMPVLTLTITFLKFDVFENNKIYKPIFLSISLFLSLFIIIMSFLGYSKFISSNNFLNILSSADKVKDVVTIQEQKEIQKKEYKKFEIPNDKIASTSVYPDNDGNGTAIFKIPNILGNLKIKTSVFTENGKYSAPEINIKSEKDILFNINTSDYMYQGDSQTCYINIKNRTPKTKKITLNCKISGDISLKDKKKNKFNFYISPNNEITKKIEIISKGNDFGKITAQITSGSYSEQIEKDIKILHPFNLYTRTSGGKLGGDISQKIRLSNDEFKKFSKIELSFYPDMLSNYCNCDLVFEKESPKYAIFYSDLIKIKLMRLKKMREKGIEGSDKIEEQLIKLIQDLLAFENKDGSFNTFENSKSEIIISASAFESLNECFDLIYKDEENLNKIYDFLASNQKEDGSWEENERTTSKVAYVLSKSKYKDRPELKKALDYLKKNAMDSFDPYTLAYTALALASIDTEATEQFAGIINKNVLHTHELCYWNSLSNLYSYSQGIESDTQATALCIRALMSVKGYDDVIRRGINYLLQERSANGTWFSTSASTDVLETLNKIFGDISEEVTNININVNNHNFKSVYLKGQKAISKVIIDKKYIQKDNTIKISSPLSNSGTYLISLYTFDKEPKNINNDIAKLNLNITQNMNNIKYGDKLIINLKTVNKGKSDIKNAVIEIPHISGFIMLNKSFKSNRHINSIQTEPNKTILYLNTIKPNEGFNQQLIFKPVQTGKMTIPPAYIYVITNPSEKKYSNASKIIVR